jgi:hypothetical protein
VFVNGIDPGFANDLLPLALAGTCQSIEQIRCMEIVDYATYDSATVMFDVMASASRSTSCRCCCRLAVNYWKRAVRWAISRG